jgi:phosphohistidine phosphatase
MVRRRARLGVRCVPSAAARLRTLREILMDLYLIRHADALALGERGITEDSDRPLSTEGEQQAGLVGKMFAQRGIRLDKLVASPHVRAQQTATLLMREGPQPAPELITSNALLPNAKPRKLAKLLRSLTGDRVGLVGHLPHIAEWAGWLIGAKNAELGFAKAGVAYIACGEFPAKGLGTLEWLVTPEWFAR